MERFPEFGKTLESWYPAMIIASAFAAPGVLVFILTGDAR